MGLFFLTSGYHVPYRNIAVFRSQKLHAVDNTPSQKVGNVNLFPGRAESKAQAVEPKSKNTESTIFDAILRAPEIQKVTKIVNDIKETPKKIERFGQSVVEVVEDVKSTPVKIQRAQQSVVKKVNDVKKNIDDTQAKVKDTIELVASAPTKIQTKVTEVKSTIDDTIEKTKYFANEVNLYHFYM